MISKKRTVGILAHVDAGKTTLSESILYLTGTIRKMGRVDHQDAFLDTDAMERSRGITIFSKQAELTIGDTAVTLLDTPGHVDFAAEMERTLQVLDYAILVINGADGVQGHTMTLWKLLERYEIPVFLFVNKMDQVGNDRNALLKGLKSRLSDSCVDMGDDEDTLYENLATLDEDLMEQYLESGIVETVDIQRLVAERKLYPCYFGSALKVFGVEELLEGIAAYTMDKEYPDTFAAKIYKITRDKQNHRLTHMKITGGSLKVKDFLTNRRGQEADDPSVWNEKADQIRVYSGTGFELLQEAPAGTICAVTGLSQTYSGQGLGSEEASFMPILEPVLTYQVVLPKGQDPHTMLLNLRQLEEEEPHLHIVWNEDSQEIHAQVMGEIEKEILKNRIASRFNVNIEFGNGSLIYKETIAEPVEGVGHFEPLRHYAEVHLLLEPGEPGSGLQFDTKCSEDVLARNWQRLIFTHLIEKAHRGVLTGSEITDMKISLTTGRAHLKHTEGGDFRQATYRAVRQGLKKAKSVLLEPIYEFRLEIPSDAVGRALSDVQKMYGECETNVIQGEYAILTGWAPVSEMREYQKEVTAYSRGSGRLFVSLKGYKPCHNAEEVIQQIGYDSEADLANPTSSVFCAHGAGFLVSWDQVEDYMHLESQMPVTKPKPVAAAPVRERIQVTLEEEKELNAIFERTYGAIPRDRNKFGRNKGRERIEDAMMSHVKIHTPKRDSSKRFLLVDGYNIVFAWEELNELARINIDAAREALMDILSNYQGFTQKHVILVFDAYKVKNNPGNIQEYNGIHVVYTREAETADQYIEKVVHEIGHKYDVTVATSDLLEQLIIWGEGAMRMSASELKEEVEAVNIQIRDTYTKLNSKEKNRPLQESLKDVKVEEES